MMTVRDNRTVVRDMVGGDTAALSVGSRRADLCPLKTPREASGRDWRVGGGGVWSSILFATLPKGINSFPKCQFRWEARKNYPFLDLAIFWTLSSKNQPKIPRIGFLANPVGVRRPDDHQPAEASKLAPPTEFVQKAPTVVTVVKLHLRPTCHHCHHLSALSLSLQLKLISCHQMQLVSLSLPFTVVLSPVPSLLSVTTITATTLLLHHLHCGESRGGFGVFIFPVWSFRISLGSKLLYSDKRNKFGCLQHFNDTARSRWRCWNGNSNWSGRNF